MNWDQFKDPVSHMCLAGTVVASWSLTQEVAGSGTFNCKYFSLKLKQNNILVIMEYDLYLHALLSIRTKELISTDHSSLRHVLSTQS